MSKIPSSTRISTLEEHVAELRECQRCPAMIGPVVVGAAVISPVMLLGQAPGNREGPAGKPFAWTAGKTMFGWFARLGLDEETFRSRVYMAAVCRCFPGKNPKGGDRVPNPTEIASCSTWLAREIAINRPELIIPVGKLAISQLLKFKKLIEVIGQTHRVQAHGHAMDAVPLPHPSGASTWHRTEPGKTLLAQALELLGQHRAFASLLPD